MMLVCAASDPAKSESANEDWFSASLRLIVVLDGATARTDTGCIHGVSWYAAHLGAAISARAGDSKCELADALASAIEAVAEEHSACDLNSPGTPSAAVGIVRPRGDTVDYLALGDISLAFDRSDGLTVITDERVEATARIERAAADRYPIGSPEKQAALVQMKHAELAARNRPGGFWVAAADAAVVREALCGSFPASTLRRAAVLTDGAARLVRMFNVLSWQQVLDLLAQSGPAEILRRVRAVETDDPIGLKWPRNKRSDDATAVYLQPTPQH